MRIARALLVAAAFAGNGACAKGIPLPGDTGTVQIPAGQYVIGGGPSTCPPQTGNCGSTTPARPIVMSQPYEIETREVTIRQYQACVELGFCCNDASNDHYADEGDLPAQVRIDQARQYCKSRNRRLPTEAEWEVAARLKDVTGTLQTYPWGDTLPNCGQVPSQDCGSGNRQLQAVATNSYDKTPMGIYDMAGSVPEWVEDDFVLGIGCRFQTSPALICSGDSTCSTNLCNVSGGCQEECQGSTNNLGCGSSDPNGGQACPTIPASEAEVDPFFATYNHAAQNQASGCQSSSVSESQYPMAKGGGTFEPTCAQNPAMRTLATDYGSSSGGGSGRQIGFRCVRTGLHPTLPTATGTAKLSLYTPPTCGLVEIASVTPDTPPAGWGTQVRVALGSNLGWAAGRYDATRKEYIIDLADKQTFPRTPCPVTSYQSLLSGSGVLVLAGVPLAPFDVQVRYPGQNGSATCVINYTQTVSLATGQGSCSMSGPPSNAYCP